VSLHCSAGYVSVGQHRLERGLKGAGREDSSYCQARQTLEVLAGCVRYSWPVIPTGASGSGKSALVSLLAQLCGRQLAVLSLTQNTDTMELLGGFEQSDASRSLGGLKDRLRPLALLPPATFHCQYDSQVASFLQQLCQGAQVGQVVSSLVALQEQYRGQVGKGMGRVGVESFLALQTTAVRELIHKMWIKKRFFFVFFLLKPSLSGKR
jgi:hypothetical protein